MYPEPVPETPVPSGTQFRIAHGGQAATIVEVGAAVREYRVGDREVFQSFPEHGVSWAYHGAVLLPWPNRLRDGRYDFDGEPQQVALSEPTRRNAIHGLVAWRPWLLVEQAPSCVTLGCRLLPSPGYPFFLDALVTYELADEGLVVTTALANIGDRSLPYALGFHPYVSAGPGATLDDCTLQIDAARKVLVDDRLIPVGDESVAGGADDFREAQPLAGRVLDTGFTDVIADAAGRSFVRVAGADGHTVEVWADANFGFWQVYSGDELPQPFARRGLAVEPMTAAPNAFESGDGLRRLEPGERVTTRWGASLR